MSISPFPVLINPSIYTTSPTLTEKLHQTGQDIKYQDAGKIRERKVGNALIYFRPVRISRSGGSGDGSCASCLLKLNFLGESRASSMVDGKKSVEPG